MQEDDEPVDEQLTEDDIAALLDEAGPALEYLAQLDGADHLIDFGRYIWQVLEPVQPFASGWALEAKCEHLEAVTRGEIKKLLINEPPGFGKSLWSDVFWPAWEWGPVNRPWTKYVCASYGQHLTDRDNEKFRTLVKSERYRAAWGQNFSLTKDAIVKIMNDKTGFKFATSVDGVGTGERGHRVIIDDPLNVKDAESEPAVITALKWLTETMPTRLIPIPAGYEDKIPQATVMIMQRVREDDPSGKILSDAKALGWEHLCLEMEFDPHHPLARKRRSRIGWRDPREVRYEASLEARARMRQSLLDEAPHLGTLLATTDEAQAEAREVAEGEIERQLPAIEGVGELAWPELQTAEHVEDLKTTMSSEFGEYAIAGQFQQQPIGREGGIFKVDCIKILASALCPKPRWLKRAWDLAGSKGKRSPYTAGALGTIQDGIFYVWHMEWEQVLAEDLESFLVKVAKRDGRLVEQNYPQDPGQAGKVQVRSIAKQLHGHRITYSPETGDKVTRATPLASQVKVGNVVFVEGPWNKGCIAEMRGFPSARLKDRTDALSRLYGACVEVAPAPPPPKVGGYCVKLPSFDGGGY
jgi:predicted phage terminase large subunit-like protein